MKKKLFCVCVIAMLCGCEEHVVVIPNPDSDNEPAIKLTNNVAGSGSSFPSESTSSGLVVASPGSNVMLTAVAQNSGGVMFLSIAVVQGNLTIAQAKLTEQKFGTPPQGHSIMAITGMDGAGNVGSTAIMFTMFSFETTVTVTAINFNNKAHTIEVKFLPRCPLNCAAPARPDNACSKCICNNRPSEHYSNQVDADGFCSGFCCGSDQRCCNGSCVDWLTPCCDTKFPCPAGTHCNTETFAQGCCKDGTTWSLVTGRCEPDIYGGWPLP